MHTTFTHTTPAWACPLSEGGKRGTDGSPPPPLAWQEIPIQKHIPLAWKAVWVRGMGSPHLQLGDTALLASPDGQEEGHGLHKKQAAFKEERSDIFF